MPNFLLVQLMRANIFFICKGKDLADAATIYKRYEGYIHDIKRLISGTTSSVKKTRFGKRERLGLSRKTKWRTGKACEK